MGLSKYKGFKRRKPINLNVSTVDDLRELNRTYDCGVIGNDKDIKFGVIQNEDLERVGIMPVMAATLTRRGYYVYRIAFHSDLSLDEGFYREAFFIVDVNKSGDIAEDLFIAGLMYDQLGFMYMPVEGDPEIIYTVTDERDSPYVGHRTGVSLDAFYNHGGWFTRNEYQYDVGVHMGRDKFCFGSAGRARGMDALAGTINQQFNEIDRPKYADLFNNPIRGASEDESRYHFNRV